MSFAIVLIFLRFRWSSSSFRSRQVTEDLMEMTRLSSDNDLRGLDCNLTSRCDHVQSQGFNNGSFSDVIVHAMGTTYRLHRLILSRTSYFSYAATFLIWRLSCGSN